ncbi:uncharacterized protein LOC135496468 [Lineus longissimus]|uniref:uncharacterized protein LOC135496468 n=1 Tax=Lineus longissimus TaxID=88925 RepID=UPI00315D4491
MAKLCERRKCGRPVQFLAFACVCSVALVYQFGLYVMRHESKGSSHHGRRYLQLTRRDEQPLCVQPKYEMYPSAKFHHVFRNISKPLCPGTNWVKINGGAFEISEFAKTKFGHNITCDYYPLMRGKRDFDQYFGPPVSNIQDGAKVTSVASKVSCSADGMRYENYHLTIPNDSHMQRRAQEVKLPQGALGMNVLMFGFDSTSRMTWQRKLPKSYAFMIDVLKCIVLEGYNIVSDGTLGALLPILTGKGEKELPDVAKGHEVAGTLDGFPWIWKDFKDAGYVTQWTEDTSKGGTFNWRMNGVKQQPMDLHAFDFYAEVETKYRKFEPYCLGAELRHNVQMNWVTDFLNVFKHQRIFSFGFHSECSHNDNKPLNIVDDDLKAWLQMLLIKGYLNNTMLILMSDHGARFQSEIRETVQGRQEERNPFFSFRLPEWFKQKHQRAFQNLLINSKRLVTPFDIHATFHHILNFRDIAVGNLSDRGISLFSKIPASRTCKNAKIAPHFCNCLRWESIPTNSSAVKKASQAFIDLANSLTKPLGEKCQLLEIESIKECFAFTPEKKLLERKTITKNYIIIYHLTLYTKPGGGHFEVTVKHNLEKNSYTLDRSDVSRVNTFGTAADCMVDEQPGLAWYCVCKNSR